MNGELLCKVIQRVEVVARIEALLILTVAALDFAVVPWRIRADQLVPDAQFRSRSFKERDQLTFRLCEAVGKLKAVISVHTLIGEPLLLEERICFLQKVC